jgi:pimeloyl-ACP methyl ester carboxylesterase
MTLPYRNGEGGATGTGMNKPSPHLVPHTHGGASDPGRSLFVTAQDGLRLHVCEYGTRSAPGRPVVCLPGLARTAADFDELAPALAEGPPPRHVIAIDSRGRGHSDHDADHANYNCTVELGDIVSVLIALGVGPAIIVGSSRGGILAMLLATMHPTAIAGVVLHDVGPVMEAKGIARIKGYVGKLPHPRSFKEGADVLRRLMSAQFPNLTAEQWLGAAQRTWHFKQGALKPAYDFGIANALAGIDIELPMPSMWNEFDALAGVPMLVIRGANSDILTAATVAAMRERRASMELIEVADQGHAPLLEGELVRQIVRFVIDCESGRHDAPTK